MNASERAPYLNAGDVALLPLGFVRKKKDYEWRRVVDPGHTEWLHLNFGRAVINPSFGVQYPDLNSRLPAEVGTEFGTMVMLSSISDRNYSGEDAPPEVVHALLLALPELKKHRNRAVVIDALKSEASTEWPVAGYSTRIRMLPLLLAGSGRIAEAFEWLDRFEVIAPTRDQMVPEYSVFARHFRAAYTV